MTATLRPPRPVGISLAGFQELIDAHGGRAAFEGKTTGWVKYHVVMPATAAARSSYAEGLLLKESLYASPATAFVSHAYDDEFLGTVDALAALEAREGSSGFYYFDLLAVNQHGQGAKVPFEVLRNEFKQGVEAIGSTLLSLRWASQTPLARAWCVFEIGTSVAVGAKMKVIMPPADVPAFKEALVQDYESLMCKTCRVNTETAKAKESDDLANIKLALAQSGGFLKTNQLVIGAMQGWMVEEARMALAALPAEERGTSGLLWNLARLLCDQGKVDEAQALHHECIAAHRRKLGDEHRDTLMAITMLAGVLQGKGELGEAELLWREVLAVQRRTRGDEHSDTVNSLYFLAVLLSDQGRLGAAEALFSEALAACRKSLAATSLEWLTFFPMTGLAACLRRQGRFDEALPLACEAYAWRATNRGETHLHTYHSAHEMGVLLRLVGAPQRALPHALAAYQGRLHAMGATSRSTLTSQLSLARLQGDSVLAAAIESRGVKE
jgi:tetratricopeptide (TPR) repeat protein